MITSTSKKSYYKEENFRDFCINRLNKNPKIKKVEHQRENFEMFEMFKEMNEIYTTGKSESNKPIMIPLLNSIITNEKKNKKQMKDNDELFGLFELFREINNSEIIESCVCV